MGWLSMRVWNMSLRMTKSTIISWHGSYVPVSGFQHVSPIETFPVNVWKSMIEIHLTAPFLLVRYFLPFMKQKGNTGIVKTHLLLLLNHTKNCTAVTKQWKDLQGVCNQRSLLSSGTTGRPQNLPIWAQELRVFLSKYMQRQLLTQIWAGKQNLSRSRIDYRKFPKYSDTQKICYNHSKIWTMWLYHRVVSPNDADGMANSVDPDEQSDLNLHCSPRHICPKT